MKSVNFFLFVCATMMIMSLDSAQAMISAKHHEQFRDVRPRSGVLHLEQKLNKALKKGKYVYANDIPGLRKVLKASAMAGYPFFADMAEGLGVPPHLMKPFFDSINQDNTCKQKIMKVQKTSSSNYKKLKYKETQF